MIVYCNFLNGRICFWSWAIIYQPTKPSRIGGINTSEENSKSIDSFCEMIIIIIILINIIESQ